MVNQRSGAKEESHRSDVWCDFLGLKNYRFYLYSVSLAFLCESDWELQTSKFGSHMTTKEISFHNEEKMSLSSISITRITEKNNEDRKNPEILKSKNSTEKNIAVEKKPQMKNVEKIKITEKNKEFAKEIELDGAILENSKITSKNESLRNIMSLNSFFESEQDIDTMPNHFNFKFDAEKSKLESEAKQEKRLIANKKNLSGEPVKKQIPDRTESRSGQEIESRSQQQAASARKNTMNASPPLKNQSTFQQDEKKSSLPSPSSPRSSPPNVSGVRLQKTAQYDDSLNSPVLNSRPRFMSENSSHLKNKTTPQEIDAKSILSTPRSARGESLSETQFIMKFSARIPIPKNQIFDASPEEKFTSVSPTSPRSEKPGVSDFIRKMSFRPSAHDGNASISPRTSPRSGLSTDEIAQLFKESWHFSVNQKGNPDLKKIPKKCMADLSDIAEKIVNSENFKKKSAEEQKDYLHQEIGKRFVKFVQKMHSDAVGTEILGSPDDLKNYIEAKFGIIIGMEVSDRKYSSASNDGKDSSILDVEYFEFHETLIKNLSGNMKGYRINHFFGKNDPEEKAWLEHNIGLNFIKNYQTETVSRVDNQYPFLAGAFLRDFGKSDYYIETAQGSLEKLSDISEFVNFFNGLENEELCSQVSHHACQYLPIVLRNAFYGRVTKDGTPVSVLNLHDGTPVSISDTQKSSYILKKTSDGGISLKYKGIVDTKVSGGVGKNNATLMRKEGKEISTKGIIMDNARADIRWEISFDAKGKANYSAHPRIMAEGWNQVTQM